MCLHIFVKISLNITAVSTQWTRERPLSSMNSTMRFNTCHTVKSLSTYVTVVTIFLFMSPLLQFQLFLRIENGWTLITFNVFPMGNFSKGLWLNNFDGAFKKSETNNFFYQDPHTNSWSTVKPVLSGHSKTDQKLFFKIDYCLMKLMQIKSIAECSKHSAILLNFIKLP